MTNGSYELLQELLAEDDAEGLARAHCSESAKYGLRPIIWGHAGGRVVAQRSAADDLSLDALGVTPTVVVARPPHLALADAGLAAELVDFDVAADVPAAFSAELAAQADDAVWCKCGQPLEPSMVAEGELRCDRCEAMLSAGDKVWSCSACDHDICTACKPADVPLPPSELARGTSQAAEAGEAADELVTSEWIQTQVDWCMDQLSEATSCDEARERQLI